MSTTTVRLRKGEHVPTCPHCDTPVMTLDIDALWLQPIGAEPAVPDSRLYEVMKGRNMTTGKLDHALVVGDHTPQRCRAVRAARETR